MKKILFFVFMMVFALVCVFPATVEKLAETTQSWDDAVLPKVSTESTKVTVLRITIASGEKLAMHEHPVINVGYLLEGELTVYTEDGKMKHIKKGESLVEVVNTWHYGKNNGKMDAVIVVIYIGDSTQPITVKKTL